MQERKQLFRLNGSMVALFPKDAVKAFNIDFPTLWANAEGDKWAGSELCTKLSEAINDAAYLVDGSTMMNVVSHQMAAEKVTDAVVRWIVPQDDTIVVKTLTVVANNASLKEDSIKDSDDAAASYTLKGYQKADAYVALVPEDTFNQAFGKLEAGINFVQEVMFKNYTTVALRSNVTIFERNVKTTPTLTIDVKFDGQAITPDSLVLKKGATVVSEDKSIKSYQDAEGITTDTTYTLEISYQGVKKTATVAVKSYFAMYMGGNAKAEGITAEEIKALNKQGIKANANGNYKFTVKQNDYGWFCVPSAFNINKMTSSGFDVPLEAAVTVAVDGENYKCYRTSSALAAGEMNVTIA